MPLPDPYANEPTVEVDPDIVMLFHEAKLAEKAWKDEADRLYKRIVEQLGDASAGTIDGVKVLSYRPKSSYAEGRLQKDYPDLTDHFREYKSVFNVQAFAQAHPEIAERYRVRALTELTGS
jgi:hypothetical protein